MFHTRGMNTMNVNSQGMDDMLPMIFESEPKMTEQLKNSVQVLPKGYSLQMNTLETDKVN